MLKNFLRGAEAVVFSENGFVVKDRVKKGYRIKEIDERLRKQRTRLEVKLLISAKRLGVNVPKVEDFSEFSIKMEYINGVKVRDFFIKSFSEDVCFQIGKDISILHEYDIIHGDLTTSNMILKGKDVFFIDFGLGFISKRAEDKATDLFVLHEALESTHMRIKEKAWNLILKAYNAHNKESDKVINALPKIESRRRYFVKSIPAHKWAGVPFVSSTCVRKRK